MKKYVLLLALLVVGALALPRAEAENVTTENSDGWNYPVAAAANVLSSSVTPLTRGKVGYTTYRLMIAFVSTSTVLNFTITRAGDAVPTQGFAINDGVALVAGRVYAFEWDASAGYTYNFSPATSTTVGFVTLARRIS